MKSAKFQIARLIFELQIREPAPEFSIPESYQPFQVENGSADLLLEASYGDIPDLDGELIFDSGGPWRIYHHGDGLAFTAHSSLEPDNAYQVAFVDKEFSRGETIIRPDVPERSPGYFPLNYPIDEVLAINRISRGHGLEVHACGLSDHGRGILFLGVSGTGKSTTARVWDQLEEVLVLSDDRIIITNQDGLFWIHGTPWHGDAGIADPSGVPLSAIFFISHAEETLARPISPVLAASQLIARSFPTYWNREGMEFSTELAGNLVQQLPAYELAFKPEPGIVDYVRGIL